MPAEYKQAQRHAFLTADETLDNPINRVLTQLCSEYASKDLSESTFLSCKWNMVALWLGCVGY